MALLVVIGLGLATEQSRRVLPPALGDAMGDALWAMMVFLVAALTWPSATTWRLAGGAAAFSIAIEASQLYHAPWIDGVRATWIGGLGLGFSFVWSDLLWYAAGITVGAGGDRMWRRHA